MIENVELTRNILELYAEEDRWPPSIGAEQLGLLFLMSRGTV